MNDNEIQELFNNLKQSFPGANQEVEKVFSVLVKTALEYRDSLNKNGQPALTVSETRKALDMLVVFMKAGHLPSTDNARVMALVRIWLVRLNIFPEAPAGKMHDKD